MKQRLQKKGEAADDPNASHSRKIAQILKATASLPSRTLGISCRWNGNDMPKTGCFTQCIPGPHWAATDWLDRPVRASTNTLLDICRLRAGTARGLGTDPQLTSIFLGHIRKRIRVLQSRYAATIDPATS